VHYFVAEAESITSISEKQRKDSNTKNLGVYLNFGAPEIPTKSLSIGNMSL
jgi:hypothetical protein